MFIQTEETPNPATLKFLPGRIVLSDGSADFPTAEAATRSPLARRLFAVEGVEGVFLGGDFVTVTKAQTSDWYRLKPSLLAAIMDGLSSGDPVIEADAAASPSESASGDDSDLVIQIKELLDTRVRPAVAQDGGDIIFHGFEDGVVSLQLQGSCSGCPSSTATLKNGIERMLQHYIPEVVAVRAV